MALQTTWDRRPGGLRVGAPSRALPDCEYVHGQLTVASGQAPKPGDGVFWNAATKKFEIPDASGDGIKVWGILGPPTSYVMQKRETPDWNFVDGDTVEVMIMGHIAVRAGATVVYGDMLVYDEANPNDHKWVKHTVTASPITNPKVPIICVTKDGGADGDTIEVRIMGAIR